MRRLAKQAQRYHVDGFDGPSTPLVPKAPYGYFQISQGGGDDVRWSTDGRQLFYRNGQAMMKVDVAGDTPASWSRPVQLFAGAFFVDGLGHKYDVDPVDDRFLMIKQAGELATRFVVVQNWFQELTERVPIN